MVINCTSYQRLSAAISWLRFPLIICVVMLHCYCTVPFESGNHYLYNGLVYPMGIWLGESGVPTFFFISGFLFYYSQKTYKDKIASRVHTLLYPYLLWNSLFLLFYFLLYLLGFSIPILGKSIGEYTIVDFIRAYIDRGEFGIGNNGPILCTYWYVRNLFVLCLLSPVWYYLCRYLGYIFPASLLAWWMSQYHNALVAESVLFFNLGAFFAIKCINPLEIVLSKRIAFLVVWLLFAIADILTHCIFNFFAAFYIHRISLVLNIFAFLFFADFVVKGNPARVNQFLAGSVFWVFATHDHLVIALRRLGMSCYGNFSDVFQIMLYIITLIVVLLCCLTSYFVMNRFFPSFVRLATGSRN